MKNKIYIILVSFSLSVLMACNKQIKYSINFDEFISEYYMRHLRYPADCEDLLYQFYREDSINSFKHGLLGMNDIVNLEALGVHGDKFSYTDYTNILSGIIDKISSTKEGISFISQTPWSSWNYINRYSKKIKIITNDSIVFAYNSETGDSLFSGNANYYEHIVLGSEDKYREFMSGMNYSYHAPFHCAVRSCHNALYSKDSLYIENDIDNETQNKIYAAFEFDSTYNGQRYLITYHLNKDTADCVDYAHAHKRLRLKEEQKKILNNCISRHNGAEFIRLCIPAE